MKSSLEHVPLCTQFGMLWCLKNNVKKWLISIQILVATDTDSKQTLDTPTNSGELYQTLVLITMVASENSNHVGHKYFYFLEKFHIWILYIYIYIYIYIYVIMTLWWKIKICTHIDLNFVNNFILTCFLFAFVSKFLNSYWSLL